MSQVKLCGSVIKFNIRLVPPRHPPPQAFPACFLYSKYSIPYVCSLLEWLRQISRCGSSLPSYPLTVASVLFHAGTVQVISNLE